MAELLTLCGYDVRTASDGAKALEAAAQFAPQLVLSDIGLPGMDGYQLAPALRRLAGSRPMVLAAVTGYGQPADRERAFTAGFDHHLLKPQKVLGRHRGFEVLVGAGGGREPWAGCGGPGGSSRD